MMADMFSRSVEDIDEDLRKLVDRRREVARVEQSCRETAASQAEQADLLALKGAQLGARIDGLMDERARSRETGG